MAKATLSDDPSSGGRILTIFLERQLDPAAEASIMRDALKSAMQTFATGWVQENRDKIMERLNVDAIANMIMVEVANDIKNEVREHK